MNNPHLTPLRELRLKKGLTQAEVAVMAGVSLSVVCWLDTDSHVVGRRKKMRVAGALGVPVDELFPSKEDGGMKMKTKQENALAPVKEITVSIAQVVDVFDAAVGIRGQGRGAALLTAWLKEIGICVTVEREKEG